jgi:hypothetical protein
MATASPLFGTAASVTITLASLASSTADVGRQSDAIDVTTLDCVDLWVGGKITLGTTPTANTRVEVWFMPSYDGTTYAGGAFGATDAAITYPSTTFPSGAKVLGRLAASLPCVVNTTGQILTWAVSAAEVFGGTLPPKFVVFITQSTGSAFNATAGNHELRYRAVNFESA